MPGAEAENLQEAFADLAAYLLVTRDAEGPYFLIHRLVQDVTRRSLDSEAHALFFLFFFSTTSRNCCKPPTGWARPSR